VRFAPDSSSGRRYVRFTARHKVYRMCTLAIIEHRQPNGKMRFFIRFCSDPNERVSIIIQECRFRWGIENFFRDSKQSLGISSYRSENDERQECGFVLSGLRYMLSRLILCELKRHPELLNQFSKHHSCKTPRTVGELARLFRREFNSAKFIVELQNANFI
jgi:hypothetical protein